jgi:hypothetical protein
MSVFAELHKSIEAIICLETTMNFRGKGDTDTALFVLNTSSNTVYCCHPLHPYILTNTNAGIKEQSFAHKDSL